MSRLDELIEQYCPNGVKFENLNNVSNITYGFPFDSNKFSEDVNSIPIIRIRDVASGKASTYYNGEFLDKYIVHKNDILVGMDGEFNLGEWNDVDSLLNQRVCKIETKNPNMVLNDFLKHVLKPIFKDIETKISGSTVKHLSVKTINNIKIPIPPIEIQEIIIELLNKIFNLNKILNSELLARKKQYEYYRNSLLNFEDLDIHLLKGMLQKFCPNGVEYKELKQISTSMYRGSGIKRDEVSNTGIPCVRYGEIYTSYNIWFDKCLSHTQKGSKTFSYGDVLFAITGESIEEIGKSIVYTGNDVCFAGGDIVVMQHSQNPKYIGYSLSTNDAQNQKSKGKVKSKVVHTNVNSLEKIIIPLPPINIQNEIVRILDNYELLINNLKFGLPAEIEARQKQYEYYREKLLTFKELEV